MSDAVYHTAVAAAPLDRKTIHDLMTPLNAIIGFSEILLVKAEGKLDERQLSNLKRINDAGKNLLERIRALGEQHATAPAPAPETVEKDEPSIEEVGEALPDRGDGAKVLVVDDVASNRELLKQDLEEAGFQVSVAGDGQGALEKAHAWEPALIILDIDMPGIDGVETCRRLKWDPLTQHIPVLFLTGAPDEETTVSALSAGGNDFLQKPYSRSILLARASSQIAIYEAQVAMRKLVISDTLTGLFSRRYLYDTVQGLLARHVRTKKPLAVAMLDVDHFKQVNDRLGHLEGDRVLKKVAEVLRASVRTGDVPARFGGEEFAVVMPEASLADAKLVAERVRAAVEAETKSGTPVTISSGVALANPSEKDLSHSADDVFRRADEALYRAKREGRNRVCLDGEGA